MRKKKKKTRTRADVFFVALVKIEIKIENNVKKVNKVLQNGHKYPQNSTTSRFLLFLLHILILILNFLSFDRIGFGGLFTKFIKLFTKSFAKSRWFRILVLILKTLLFSIDFIHLNALKFLKIVKIITAPHPLQSRRLVKTRLQYHLQNRLQRRFYRFYLLISSISSI